MPEMSDPSVKNSEQPSQAICWRAVEILTAAFLVMLSVVAVVSAGRVAVWPALVGVNAAVIAFIGLMAWGAHRSENAIIRTVYDWYPAPMIFLIFKEVYFLIQALQIPDRDSVLIGIDRAVFGGDPTVWFHGFASPLLTELFQIAYASYFFILVGTGLEVYLRKEMNRFEYYLFLCSFGFFTSYIGYLLVPGVGPRFTLHDFSTIGIDLPGLWLTSPIRAILDAGESIPAGAADALRHAQRDVFPSGHTELTLICLYLAFHWKLRSRWVMLVAGTLLIVSTVYLRYHYVVDVAAGAVLAGICMTLGRPVFQLFKWDDPPEI